MTLQSTVPEGKQPLALCWTTVALIGVVHTLAVLAS